MILADTKHFVITVIHKLRHFEDGLTIFNLSFEWNRYKEEEHLCGRPDFYFIFELFNYKIIEVEFYEKSS